MVSCQQTFPSSEKTKYMIFTHSEDRINFKELNIVLNYNEPGRNNPDLISRLDFVNSKSKEPYIKFLGVHLDPKLDFKIHMNYIGKKISTALYLIRSAKHLLSSNSLKTLYYSLVHCHLIYCIEVWSCGHQASLNKLFLKQKQAIRVITGSKYNSHTEPLFKRLEILPLHLLARCFKLQFMYKFINNRLPTSFNNMWMLNRNRELNHNLRNANDLVVPFIHLKRLENLPFISYAKLWNDLIPELKSITSKSLFYSNLKSLSLSSLSEVVHCTHLFCRDCSSSS